MTKELEVPIDLSVEKIQQSGLPDKEIESVLRTTQTFQNILSGLVLNVAAAKIGFEGGTTKTTTDREFAA